LRFGPRAERDETLLDLVMKQFQLGSALPIQDLGGTYNLNLHVRTISGEYVVRVHRPWVTRARLGQLHDVRKTLVSAKLPIPELMVSCTGKTTYCYQDRLVTVERFVVHEATADNWERYEVAFALLGRLHDILVERVDTMNFTPPRISNYGAPEMLLRWLQQTEYVVRQFGVDAKTKQALDVCNEVRQLLVTIRVWWQETGDQLPQQLIHGDYGGENLLFTQDQAAAILDFDFLAIRERIFELAYCIYWMLTRLEAKQEPACFSWDKVREMLKHYNAAATRPLTAREIRAIVPEMARLPLYWVAEAGFLPHCRQAIINLTKYISLSRWLLQHNSEVTALLMGNREIG